MPDCPHDSDALAPVLVQVHPDGVFSGAPRVALAHPHVTAGLVKVDDVLVHFDAARQVHYEMLNLLQRHSLCTTELVLDNSVGNPVTAIEQAQRVRGNLDSQISELLDSLIQVQVRPLS